MDPATIATIASAGSSILSAFGFGKKQKKGPSIEEQLAAQRASQQQLDLERPSWIRQGAEKAGLHPLAVMGISPASGGSFFLDGGQQKQGVDFNALGQGIDRAANAYRTSTQRKLDELALEQAQLSNDYLRTQIAGAQQAIVRSGQAVPLDPIRDTGDSSGVSSRLSLGSDGRRVVINPDKQVASAVSDTGRSAGKHPSFMTIDLGNGMTAEVPRTDDAWGESIGEMPIWYKHPKMAEILSKRHLPKLWEKKYSKKWLAPWDKRRWQK